MYVAGLVFDWLNDLGGLSVIEKTNIEKSNLLYEKIDSTDFYVSPIRKEDRSRMNVPFRISEPSLEKEFLKKAEERGLLQLKGHRSVGGIRASIYNAMPIQGVCTLVDFMSEFERENG
jgi:phosphoserine aminotransferase